MTLLPFATNGCTMCGMDHPAMSAGFRYCASGCISIVGRDQYGDMTTHGQSPTPHMHRTCKRCGFEWLTETIGVR